MQLGLSLSPVVAGSATSSSLVEQMATAASAGAATIFLGDRAPDENVIARSNAVLLAAALSRMPAGVTVGSFYLAADWPLPFILTSARTLVELAEEVGAKPALTVALGRGPAGPPPDGGLSRVERLENTLDALRIDPVTGRAELWIASERGTALQRAGRLADVWLGNAHTSAADLHKQAAVVVAAAAEAQRTAPRLAFRRDIVCEATDEAAQRFADDAMAAGYRGGKVPRSSLIVGSPRTCAQQLAEMAAAGFDDCLVRPVATGRQALETLERFFTEVKVANRSLT